ncbi:MAG: aromatic ring-hydroxylating dioxygenase subunit alpha [Ilumatobacter sp.]|uniref:aromatic ring-hydroxylating oxygenase subunit alpha n=1 Tax=Ilumatobacter sp. TaxID=1967498 RepID=UPI00260C2EAD|nr:aromatic ring-hydroxylating dioxygenase subunit alpha [Ilumatobacter sp.]MDJ0767149.1 aromatic ring-hydroxylating dioxygenase subunit alpha [Ilumatobacter sp.]
MDHRTQLALIERIQAHRTAGRGTDTAPTSMLLPTTAYTERERFDRERRLLVTTPTIVGLSGLLPEPNTHATVEIGDRSVIVTRDTGGDVHAMLNVCRHRGAEVAHGCGAAARLRCPYHGWTYELDGALAARRGDQHFDDRPAADLARVPVLERGGLIWVNADRDGSIPDQPLTGADAELAPFDLASYRHFGTRTFTRDLNWKLAVDTFCEAYHVAVLHRDTLAPMIHSDFALFDAAGLHGRLVAVRRSFTELDEQPVDQRSLFPHATILWFLMPNTVLIHQQDHVQLYQSRPGATPEQAHLTVSIYVPPDSPRSDQHWERNFDLLVEVTDTEDFATAAGIQRNYYAGAQTHVTFGRNEPALQHYHRSLLTLLEEPT